MVLQFSIVEHAGKYFCMVQQWLLEKSSELLTQTPPDPERLLFDPNVA